MDDIFHLIVFSPLAHKNFCDENMILSYLE